MIDELIDYCEEHKAWGRGFLQYGFWARVINYLYKNIISIKNYDVKKIFELAVACDLFYVEKRGYRYYYKYKSENEEPVDRFKITFD